jgi:hypothetical protein
LAVFDVTDPRDISRVATYDDFPIETARLELDGDLLIAYEYNRLGYCSPSVVILDVSDPSNINGLTTFLAAGPVKKIAAVDHTLYIATWNRQIQILDISDPSRPVLQSVYETGPSFADMTAQDDKLFVLDSESGVEIISVADPSSPVLLSTYDFAIRGEMVYVHDSYLYVYDHPAYSRMLLHFLRLKG